MNLNLLIERKLIQKNMSKQALYKKVSEIFYSDAKQISYPSFLARIAENKLSAIDFFEIAEILEIDAKEIQVGVHQKAMKAMNSLPVHIQGIIKKESLFCRDGIEYEMINTGSGSKYDYYKTHLLCIDRSRKLVTLELFDFLNSCIVLTKVDYKNGCFEEEDFNKMLNESGEDKVKYIEGLAALSESIYTDAENYKLIRKLNIPEIDWEFDYSYTDVDDIEARIKYIYKGDKSSGDFIKDFEAKIKEDLISLIERNDASVDVDGIVAIFDIVNSDYFLQDDKLKVIYNIKIKSLVR